ncbi:MAG: zinc ribbon domain-containing protein [Thermoleophilia bacterium]
MWVCPNCGEELSDMGVTFCGACGSRISSAEEVDDRADGYGAPEKYSSQYRSDEATEFEDSQIEPDVAPPAKYWSDEDTVEEGEDNNGGDGQPDTNIIPEDLSSLTKKLESMMRNAYDPQAKDLVLLKRFSSQEEALMVKGLLDCESIPAMNHNNMLYVRQDDLETAREITGSD